MKSLNTFSLLSSMTQKSIVSAGARAIRGVATTSRAVVFEKFGEPQDVTRVISYPIGEVGPDEVLLKTLASTINPSDINQVQGVYPSRPVFSSDYSNGKTELAVGGNEGVFEVLEVGKNVTNLHPGDWTMPASVSFGTWRSHALVNSKTMSGPIAVKGVTPTQVVTSNINPVSAYQMLKNYATLSPGDWVIQNGGNSAVGRAVIQLCKLWGYKSISVVRSRDNIEDLIAELKDLGADHVITEEQLASKEFKPTIKEWTKDNPIKLGLNCVGGKSATNISTKLGKDGHLVTYGAMSKQPLTVPTGLLIFNNITFHGFWLTANIKADPSGRNAALAEILGLVAEGKFKTAPILKHLLSADKSDEANTEISKAAFESYAKGFSNKKHVFVWE